MIVPRTRLLQWSALVLLSFALLAALVPFAWPLSVGAVLCLAVLALIDAILAADGLKGLSLAIPEVIRFSKDHPSELELRITNQRPAGRHLRIGLAFPDGFSSPKEEVLAVLPPDTEVSRLGWPCLPIRRGRHLLERAYLEASSPLGFWGLRSAVVLEGQLRVYPNLLRERRHLAALFLRRGGLGLHAHRQVGKGREFEKLREDIPGDSYDEVHWKATAKRGRPVTKVFQIERTQEVYVIVDASRLTARTSAALPDPALSDDSTGEGGEAAAAVTPSETVLDRFLTSALILCLAAEQQGDLFGLVTFSDKVQQFVRAKNGREHYNTCRDTLYTLHSQTVTPAFDELCTFIRLRLRRRALLVLLTALDDPVLAESFIQSVRLLTRQHLLLVNMLQPPGARPLFSQTNVSALDDVYTSLGGHLLWHDLRELGKTLQRFGVQFSLLESENMSAQLVSQYLSVKQRQLL